MLKSSALNPKFSALLQCLNSSCIAPNTSTFSCRKESASLFDPQQAPQQLNMACSMLSRTRCFSAGASTATRAAQPTRTVRMVVRATSQKQQLPSIVKPAMIAAGRRSLRTGRTAWGGD